VVKEPTGRKPGGQPGHPAYQRVRLPPEQVQHTIALVPDRCASCQAPLPAQAGPQDPEPTWHQIAELPRVAAVVTEYQGHARTCSCCGHVTRAEIPAVLQAHVIGERLGAAMSFLAASPHVSKRGVEEVVETVFGVPVSLGTVANLEQEMSQALAAPHAEAQQAVQRAPVKNVDETSWKEAGHKRWLWTAATATVACFVIHTGRGARGLAALLGDKIRGIVCSDRWAVYGRLAAACRQVCWAHLKRDFQKLVDRGGTSKEYGSLGLAVVAILFH
jgi:transposase